MVSFSFKQQIYTFNSKELDFDPSVQFDGRFLIIHRFSKQTKNVVRTYIYLLLFYPL